MRRLLKVFLLFSMFLIVSGCGEEEDVGVKVALFSDIPLEFNDDFEGLIQESTPSSSNIEFSSYAGFYEKLIVEFISKEIDLFLVDEALIQSVYDPEAFKSLDTMLTDEQLKTVPDEYKYVNEETGETNVHAYPLGNDSKLLKEIGIELERPLIAFIPIFSGDSETTSNILESLIE